ncbi:MAG: hypothetical protein Q4G34_01090 [Micrococcus sp.]|nr:hypothetical protein [Micrococcus sp.]
MSTTQHTAHLTRIADLLGVTCRTIHGRTWIDLGQARATITTTTPPRWTLVSRDGVADPYAPLATTPEVDVVAWLSLWSEDDQIGRAVIRCAQHALGALTEGHRLALHHAHWAMRRLPADAAPLDLLTVDTHDDAELVQIRTTAAAIRLSRQAGEAGHALPYCRPAAEVLRDYGLSVTTHDDHLDIDGSADLITHHYGGLSPSMLLLGASKRVTTGVSNGPHGAGHQVWVAGDNGLSVLAAVQDGEDWEDDPEAPEMLFGESDTAQSALPAFAAALSVCLHYVGDL